MGAAESITITDSEVKKRLLFRTLIKNSEICKRLCNFARNGVSTDIDFRIIKLILLDWYKNEKSAMRIYHILRNLGFLEERVVDYELQEELNNPMKSRKFRQILRKYKIRGLEEITPEIAEQISRETDYVVEVGETGVRVFRKLKTFYVSLSELAREECLEEAGYPI